MKKLGLSLSLIAPMLAFSQSKKKDTVKTTHIEEVMFRGKSAEHMSDLGAVKISTKDTKNVTSISGGIEGILKTLPSVNSNTELSSQYMVRGGNYDENLIYINGIEIYRPFLIRNSQQEGLSIINPDMVSTINFSAGGFEPKYGDKMSSALHIDYREPKKAELSGEASLMGGRLTAGFASKNKKLTALFSGRYRNLNLLFNTLKEDTNFNPVYLDFQSYINYHINSKLSLSFMGYYSKNYYEMIPKERSLDFGTRNQPLNLTVNYKGKENDQYKNMMGTLSMNFKPSDQWKFTLDAFAYKNREKEYYSIESKYTLQTINFLTGVPTEALDSGKQLDYARNDLFVRTYGMQFRGRFSPGDDADIEIGLKYEKENLKDLTNEWKLIDSAGYSLPRPIDDPRLGTQGELRLLYRIAGENAIQPTRLSAYAQYSQKLDWGMNKVSFNAGARVSHWSFNQETIFSPRMQFSIMPYWNAEMTFRLSGGVYYQAPFYKEIKDLSGNFNSSIKSQRSLQLILANDYQFQMYDRPFKLTTEAYYKKMDNLIPYYMDNVRIRYSGKNNTSGYAYGIETRLSGEFVPGLESWISASYARAYENIGGKGDIPRPTDQRFRFAMFYQDYMPKFPSIKMNLTLTYAMGIPTGTPIILKQNGEPNLNAAYQYQKTLPSYKRIDMGVSKAFIDYKDRKKRHGFWSNFEELTLGLQVFNVFVLKNAVATQWITDSNTNLMYSVPVRTTGRFFNLKLEFRIK
ncbi:Outer membrane receptor proteins, mostly Fe transport [Chryseobacterium oleae]|uniref:Outer membrane receptor proteins, mostly Fe transport n=1 Tax=Chryseobacterium oleae TaxID=491207 RepID=A0A1I5D4D8_CHROL|nr:TonB-dependent receptor [Chryseobacterium oleae]SFN94070.1 Outer membrane receptor proteins, mostly Fe transport [Chryseobacterium oleae]